MVPTLFGGSTLTRGNGEPGREADVERREAGLREQIQELGGEPLIGCVQPLRGMEDVFSMSRTEGSA